MEFNRFAKRMNEVVSNDKLKTRIIYFLMFMVFVLSMFLWRSHERVVIIPPQLDRKAIVGWNEANRAYLEEMSVYIVKEISQAVPSNVDYLVTSLEKYFDMRVWKGIEPQLKSIKTNPKYNATDPISQFVPNSVIFEKETSKIFVTGELKSYIYRYRGVEAVGQVNATYELKMRMKNGRPNIYSFFAYVGSPKTIKWERQNPQEAEAEKKNRKKYGEAENVNIAPEVTAEDIQPAYTDPLERIRDKNKRKEPEENSPIFSPQPEELEQPNSQDLL